MHEIQAEAKIIDVSTLKRLILLTFTTLMILSCSLEQNDVFPGTSDQDKPTDGITVSNELLIDGTSMTSFIAPLSYDMASSSETEELDAHQFLSYDSGSGYFPIKFLSENGQIVLLGNSKDSLKLLDTGDGTFLCVFDRLVISQASPIAENEYDEDGVIRSLSLSIKVSSVDKKESVAYIDMMQKKAYLLSSSDSAPFQFCLDDNQEEIYGYSSRRVYLLSKEGVLFTFERNNPAELTPVNHKGAPISRSADLYTDDYVIYQSDDESPDYDGHNFIRIYDSSGKRIPRETEYTDGATLSNALFRVENGIYIRDSVYNYEGMSEYAFVIHGTNIDGNMMISADEGNTYVIADECVINPDSAVKNSGMFIPQGDETLILRIENRYTRPLIVKATANSSGRLSEVVTLRLAEGEYFPFPISETRFCNNALYWIDGHESCICIADFTAKVIRRIRIDGILPDSLAIMNDGSILYNKAISGNMIETYLYNPAFSTERPLLHDMLDVNQIHDLGNGQTSVHDL